LEWQKGIHSRASGNRSEMRTPVPDWSIARRTLWGQQKNGNQAYVGNVTGGLLGRDLWGWRLRRTTCLFSGQPEHLTADSIVSTARRPCPRRRPGARPRSWYGEPDCSG